MLVTSIFSFSQNVFNLIKHRNLNSSSSSFVMCKCSEFGQIKKLLLGKGLSVKKSISNSIIDELSKLKVFAENTLGKQEIARNEQFLFPTVFSIFLTHSHTMTPFDAPGKQAL